jgi:hypothetical protein
MYMEVNGAIAEKDRTKPIILYEL